MTKEMLYPCFSILEVSFSHTKKTIKHAYITYDSYQCVCVSQETDLFLLLIIHNIYLH